MKYAAAFRRIARDALRGNWGIAVLTGFVASLIGANLYSGYSTSSSINNDSSGDVPNELQITEFVEKYLSVILVVLLITLAVILIYSTVIIIISGAAQLGYAKFNLNLIDRKPAAFSDLFSQFNRLGQGFCMSFLIGLYTLLWTLLFIIPGLIKSFSYSMTPYILAEHPEMTASEAITESRRIMKGNKGRLFCLRFSFIGWEFLTLLPMLLFVPLISLDIGGIVLWAALSIISVFVGSLFLMPYAEAAQAAFYREVSNTNLPYSDSLEPENANI